MNYDEMSDMIKAVKGRAIKMAREDIKNISTYKLNKAGIGSGATKRLIEKPESMGVETIIGLGKRAEKIKSNK